MPKKKGYKNKMAKAVNKSKKSSSKFKVKAIKTITLGSRG